MLISETHNFLFIAIPKTGTHSIRNTLRQISTDEHVGTGGGVCNRKKSQYSEIHHVRHGHLTCQQLQNLISNWSKLTKFAVIRNPYDRAISFYFFRQTKRKTQSTQLKETEVTSNDILKFYQTLYKNFQIKKKLPLLTNPQTYFIYDQNKENLLVDYLIRFETYQSDFDKLADQLGISHQELPVVNKSHHREYQYYYQDCPELQDLIKTLYADDFRLLGYSLDITCNIEN